MAAGLTPPLLLLLLLPSLTADHLEGPGPTDSGGPGRTLGDQGDLAKNLNTETPSTSDDIIDTEAPNIEKNAKTDETCTYPTTQGSSFKLEPSQASYERGARPRVTCSWGYRPSPAAIECLQKDQSSESDWDVTPTCIKTCTYPTTQGSSFKLEPSQASYERGARPSVTCSWGYRPSPAAIECLQKDQSSESDWDVTPTCIKLCENPSSRSPALILTPHKEWYYPGESVGVTCRPEYQPSSYTIECRQLDPSTGSAWDETPYCIQLCKYPSSRSPVLTLTPHKEWYNPGESVRVTCPTGYQPSDSTMVCRQLDETTQSAWNVTVTCIQKCRKPATDGSPFILSTSKLWYDRGDKVQVTCSEGYQPSPPQIECRKKQWSDDSEWDGRPTCTQRCRNPTPQWPPFTLSPYKPWYDRGDKVQVTCSEEKQPSPSQIECSKKQWNDDNEWNATPTCIQKCRKSKVANIITENPKEYYRAGEWMRVSCTEGYEVIDPRGYPYVDVRCVRQDSANVWQPAVPCIEIKEEKLTVSARRITLTLTCSNSNCENIWEISATALKDYSGGCSRGEQSTRCAVSYNNGTVSDCTALQPSSQYTLTVRGRYRRIPQEVLLYSARMRTNETVPDKPEMETNEVKINNKTIKWKKLSDCKGMIQGYQLNITSWRAYNKTFQEREYVTVNSAITEYTVRRPGTNYTITIQGFTSAGPGKPLTYRFTTVISEPVIPSFIILKESNISATEKMVVLPLHPVPDIHGPISEYQIIVSRKRSMGEDICQREDLAPFNSSLDQDVYITAALPGHNLTSPEEFVLGDGTYQHGYYNAPLRAGHNYTAFLRVISIWDQDRTYSCALYGASPDAVQMKEGSSFTVFNGIQVAQIVIMLLGVMVVSLLFKSGTSQSSTLDSDEHGHTSVFS